MEGLNMDFCAMCHWNKTGIKSYDRITIRLKLVKRLRSRFVGEVRYEGHRYNEINNYIKNIYKFKYKQLNNQFSI